MSLPHAVILAGGRGERLGGVRKADLRVGGRRLVDRVTDALGAVAAPLMISTGSRVDWRDLPEGMLVVPDLDSDTGGPLAGLAAAIAALHRAGIAEGLLVSVAVDSPFLPDGFAAAMADRLGDAVAAYAVWGNQYYPTNAVWRIEALADLPHQVLEDRAPHSLRALHEALAARAVDWTQGHEQNPFANINTVADLVGLGWLAREAEPSPLIHKPGN